VWGSRPASYGVDAKCKAIPPALRVSNWQTALSAEDRRYAVARGPVIAGMRVFDDFRYYTGGIYEHATGDEVGLHAVCVIGYDDDASCWIAKNSWFEAWGEKGRFRIAMGSAGSTRNFRSSGSRSNVHDGLLAMIRNVPKGTSAVNADLGQALELALPGAGTTGYRWEARATDGLDVERLPARPGTSFGCASCDIFQVTPRRHGDITLQWELRAPWQTEPADNPLGEAQDSIVFSMPGAFHAPATDQMRQQVRT
jgi:hypothetical protein